MKGPRGRRAIIIAVVTALVVASASGLAALSVARSAAMAFIIACTVALTIGSALSLEIGIFAIILVACTDGILKGWSPGWHTQVLKDYFLGICLLRWSWLSVLGDRRVSARHPLAPALMIFMAWCFMQMFNPATYSYVLALAGFRGWVIWLALFFVTYDYLRSRAQVERLVLFIVVLLIPISIYGIIQYQIGYEHLYRLGPGFDVYRHQGYITGTWEVETRPASTMISSNNLGAALSCALLMAVGAVLYFVRRPWHQLLTLASIPLSAAAMLLTGSRAPLAGTAIGGLALLILSRRPRVAIILAIAMLIAVTQTARLTGGALGPRLSSLWEDRAYTKHRVLAPWRTAVHYARQHVLGSGVGVGSTAGRLLGPRVAASTPVQGKVPWAENDFGRALVELGVPGLLIFLWMLYCILREMVRAYRELRRQQDRWLVAGLFGACVGVLARISVGSPLYVWPEAIFFWVSVAAVTKLPSIQSGEDAALREQAAQAPEAQPPGDGEVTSGRRSDGRSPRPAARPASE